MLLGASVVLLSAVGEPSAVHAGCAHTGLLLWLLGVARLLLFATTTRLPGGASSAAVTSKKHCSIFAREDPEAAGPQRLG
jgi:hypothetical protein